MKRKKVQRYGPCWPNGASLRWAQLLWLRRCSFLVPKQIVGGQCVRPCHCAANFIPLPVSAITMALNVLFLVLGFLLIGGEFGAKTVYTSILLPLLLGVLERLFPNNGSIMGDQFLDML